MSLPLANRIASPAIRVATLCDSQATGPAATRPWKGTVVHRRSAREQHAPPLTPPARPPTLRANKKIRGKEIAMDLGIAGRKAIVCASSKGLGRGCAMALAEAGCEVVVNGRNEAGSKPLPMRSPRRPRRR